MKYLLTCWLFVVVASHPLGMPKAIIINNGKNNNNIRETERERERRKPLLLLAYTLALRSLTFTRSLAPVLSVAFLCNFSHDRKNIFSRQMFFFFAQTNTHRRAWTCRLADDKHASPLLNLFSLALPSLCFCIVIVTIAAAVCSSAAERAYLLCKYVCMYVCACKWRHRLSSKPSSKSKSSWPPIKLWSRRGNVDSDVVVVRLVASPSRSHVPPCDSYAMWRHQIIFNYDVWHVVSALAKHIQNICSMYRLLPNYNSAQVCVMRALYAPN